MGMGSLSKIASMIPGMPAGMMDGNEEDTSAKMKRMVFITDAMRQDELDSDGLIFVRIYRQGVSSRFERFNDKEARSQTR